MRDRAGPHRHGRGEACGGAGSGPSVGTMCIYEPRPGLEGGRRILVTRHYPRGIRRSHFDDWARELAPSRELLKRYRAGSMEWRDFAGAYLAELRGSDGARLALQSLRRAAKNGEEITLLCFEPDGAPCHRHILRRLVENPRGAWARALVSRCDDRRVGVPVRAPPLVCGRAP